MIAMTQVRGEADVKKVWPFVKDFIQRSVNASQGDMSLEDAAKLIVSGEGQLWVAWDVDNKTALGFVISSHTRKGSGAKVCNIELIGGNRRKEWIDKLDVLYDDARKGGCSSVKAELPRSWIRDLRDFSVTRYVGKMAL